MTADRFGAVVERLHPRPVRDALALGLTEGPVVVSAQPGAGELALLSQVAEGRDLVRLDARTAGNRYGLVVDLTRAILARLAPGSHIGLHHASIPSEDRLALAERFGGQTEDAIGAAMGLPPDDAWSVDLAARGLGDAVLVVEYAHLLTQKWAGPTLWTLRGYAAESGATIALLTRPWHADALLSADSAFFGFARRVDVVSSARPQQVEALARSHPGIEAFVGRVSGQIAAIAELLVARRPAEDLEETYDRLVTQRAAPASALLSAAQAISALGGRMLVAIAHGLPPYREAVRAVPARVATALSALRDADLIYPPEPRRWAISDQLTAAALRRIDDPARARLTETLAR